MTDKTHQLIGLTAATAFVVLQQPELVITWPIAGTVLLGSFLGSIAPDIDQPTSNFWDTVPLGGFIGKLTSRALGGHRNLSHSLLGLTLFYLLITWFSHTVPDQWFIDPNLLIVSFVIGFIAHLMADSVTVRGIPLFWPFGRDMGFPPYPLHGIRIITGKWFENLIIFPATGLVLAAFLLFHAERLCRILLWLCKIRL